MFQNKVSVDLLYPTSTWHTPDHLFNHAIDAKKNGNSMRFENRNDYCVESNQIPSVKFVLKLSEFCMKCLDSYWSVSRIL